MLYLLKAVAHSITKLLYKLSSYINFLASLTPAMQETLVQFLRPEDLLEKG